MLVRLAPFNTLSVVIGLSACAGAKPTPAATPESTPTGWANDGRVGLRPGLYDAQEAVSHMKVLARGVSPEGFRNSWNSDISFTGKYAVQGNFNGVVIWDISDSAKPTVVTSYPCPASQHDVSVYRNLMFMSVEANNGRVDCMLG